jgi:excisionase family DNA binding protein
MQNSIIITTHSELQNLVQDAVFVAVQQLSLPQKIDPLPHFLTIEQAGQYLNLAKQTLYGYVSSRTIPFIKKGKKLYFVKTEIDKWLAEGSKYTRNQIIQNLKPNN